MDDGLSNDDRYEPIFDSAFNPVAEMYLVSGLIGGLTYRFEVKARDHNGLGPVSPTASLVACTTPATPLEPVLLT